MKKQSAIACFGLFCALLSCLSYRGGLTMTRAQGTATPDVEQITPLDQKIAEAAFLTTTIELLDSGRTQDAAHVLRLRQGADILALNELLSSASEQPRRRATQLLGRIAKSGAKWKSDYRGDLPQADTNAAAQVESILKRYR